MQKCCYNFFSRPQPFHELNPLLPSLQNAEEIPTPIPKSKAKKFLIKCVKYYAETALTGGSIEASFALYSRIFSGCHYGDPCADVIAAQAAHIGVGLAWLNFSLKVISTSSCLSAHHKKIEFLTNQGLEIIANHTFLLHFTLYGYGEIAKLIDPENTEVKANDYFLFAIAADVILAILTSRALRFYLRSKCGIQERGVMGKLVDSSFGLIYGFSTGRGVAYSTESNLDYLSKSLNAVRSIPGILSRYGAGLIVGIMTAIYEWNYPFTPGKEPKSWLEWGLEKSLTTMWIVYFSGWIFDSFYEKFDLDAVLDSSFYLLLLATMFSYAGYKVFGPKSAVVEDVTNESEPDNGVQDNLLEDGNRVNQETEIIPLPQPDNEEDEEANHSESHTPRK